METHVAVFVVAVAVFAVFAVDAVVVDTVSVRYGRTLQQNV